MATSQGRRDEGKCYFCHGDRNTRRPEEKQEQTETNTKEGLTIGVRRHARIKVTFQDGITAKACISTGSTHSFIDQTFLNSLKTVKPTDIEKVNVLCRFAGQNPFLVKERVLLQFEYEGRRLQQKFFVVPKMVKLFQLVLAADFCWDYGVSLKFLPPEPEEEEEEGVKVIVAASFHAVNT